MPDTDNFDAERVAQHLNKLLTIVNDSDELTSAFLEDSKDQQSYSRSGVMNDAAIEIFKRMGEYHTLTDIIGQMNEAKNANQYIENQLSREKNRIARLNLDAQKEIYKIQQKYLDMAYRRQYSRFITHIMLLTWGLVAVLAIMTGLFLQRLMEPALFAVGTATLLALYTVSLVAAFSYEFNRRRFHWKQFYWHVGEKIKDSVKKAGEPLTCKNAGQCA